MMEFEFIYDVLANGIKKYISLFLLLTSSLILFGQKSEKHFGLGTGWYYHNFKDPLVSTVSNKGSSISLLLFFRSNGEKNRHHIEFLYATPDLQSTYLLAREQTGYLQYAYHRKIGIVKNNIHFFAGGIVNASASYLKYSEIDNSYSYLYPFVALESIGSLSPSVLAELPLGKGKLSIQAWTSLSGYAFGGLKYQRGWVWIGDLWNTGFRGSYSKHFSDKWEGRLDYQFQYYTLKRNGNTSSHAHHVNFSLVYKFHR